MAKHARIHTDEQRERLERNRATLLSVLSGERREVSSSTQTSGLTLVLERFVVDHATWQSIPYEGENGVERLMDELAKAYADERVLVDGHLVGLGGTVAIDGQDQPLRLQVDVGAGAQLRVAVEPADNVCATRAALSAFDRQLHVAHTAMGCDFDYVAQGYHPAIADIDDSPLVPVSKNILTDTFLSRRRGHGRELIRCTAATRLRLPVDSIEQTIGWYQLLVALSPILAFLTDNTLHVRSSDPDLTPLMARTLLAEQSVPHRIGIPDGMLGAEASLEGYERWLEGVRPIFLACEDGTTIPTGADTIEQLMCVRDLTPTEATHLTLASWSVVRLLGREVELSCADSLPPRLACAYLALMKGLLASERTRGAVALAIGLSTIDEAAIQSAWRALRLDGWNARVYGHRISQLANDLSIIASGSLEELEERRLLVGLTQLWEVECVPRDLAQSSPDFDAAWTSEQELIDLYKDVMASPFENLDSDPPADSTSVLRFRHLF